MSDCIDTRDLVEERNELRELVYDVKGSLDEDDVRRLHAIEKLFRELEDIGGNRPEDGVIMIPDYEFEAYARSFAEEIGAINDDARWPNNHIDWEAAARHLQMDYTAVTFEDSDYWVR
jgi:hypothetical protein